MTHPPADTHARDRATVTIRPAGPTDAGDIAAMVAEIAAHEDQAAHVHVHQDQWRRLLARPDVTVLLAERDGRPCPLQAALRIEAFPTLVLVDRHGTIVWREKGASPTTLARLDRILATRVDAKVVRR